MMSTALFFDVLEGLRNGHDSAASEVYRRYVRRLVVLAARQFNNSLKGKADPESAVQSAFGSFFADTNSGRYELGSWEAVWALLVTITVHKCSRRRDYWNARRRAARRTVGGLDTGGAVHTAEPQDRVPTPDQAAALNEVARQWLVDLPALDREVVRLGLEGYTDAEVARSLDRSQRTVRRVRQRAEADLTARLGPEAEVA